MSLSANAMLIKLRKTTIAKRYEKKGRFIDRPLYNKLKAKNRCDRCNKSPIIPEIHHIIPVSKGGKNTEDNLQVLCPECHKMADKEI